VPPAADTYRICQKSRALGGTASTYRDAAMPKAGTSVTFTCPPMLDGAPGEGGYSVYLGESALF
jgi:hypothetical protein